MSPTYRIGVLPGDGTGPEVVREGLKVLEAVRGGFDVDLVSFDLGGERYLRTGEVLPDEDLARLKELDAIFLGAIGHPEVRPGILERDLLLRIRFALDQYVNLRPGPIPRQDPDTVRPAHSDHGSVVLVDRGWTWTALLMAAR